MSQENNIAIFVSLTPISKNGELSPSAIEINPSYIVYMARVSPNNMMPYTKLLLSTGDNVSVIETPEEIDQAITESYTKTMKRMTPMMVNIFEDLEDFDEGNWH